MHDASHLPSSTIYRQSCCRQRWSRLGSFLPPWSVLLRCNWLPFRTRDGWLGLGSSGKVLFLDGWLWRCCSAASAVDVVLGLRRVVVGIGADDFRSATRVLRRKISELGSLLSDHLTALVKLSIDDFLILEVNERAHVQKGGSNQRETPQWKPFN
jgi:hypothetical protein